MTAPTPDRLVRFVVLAFGSAVLPAGITLGSVDTATSVQDRALRDGTFDGPASALTGIQVLEASDLDVVLDTAARGRHVRGAARSRDRCPTTALADAWQAHWSRLIGLLIGQFARPDLAEDAVSDAFEAAARHWPVDGVPTNTGAWLLTAARRRVLDRLRSEAVHRRKEPLMVVDDEMRAAAAAVVDPGAHVADEQLRLIFACCHPAIAPDDRVALTLRFVVGLTTTEIARLLLVQESDHGRPADPREEAARVLRHPLRDARRRPPGRAPRRRRDRRLPRLHLRLPPRRRRRPAARRPRRRGHPAPARPRLPAARPRRRPLPARPPAPAALPPRHPPRPRPAP